MPLRIIVRLLVALAVLVTSAAAIADGTKQGTAAERAALGAEDATQIVSAADLAAPQGLSRFTGKPILRVETVTVGGLWSSKETITAVRPGEAYSGEAARRAVREIMARGRFARAGVEAYLENGGVVLRLALLPRRVIATLTLSGGVLDRGETLEAAGLSEGGEVTAPALDLAESRISALYASRGFPKARVSADATDTDDPDQAVVSIEVDPGPPLLITRRTFVIDPVVQAEVGALRDRYKIDPALNPFEEILRKIGFPITPGERADETLLSDADRELADVLRQSGFLRAEVRHQLVRTGSSAVLFVKIAAGPRLVPLFDGNRTFDADQLTAALELGNGGGARSGELAEKLRDFYVKRGFLDAEVAVSERGDPADAIHYLTFRIVENRRVRVTRRLFPCLTGELSADDVGGEIQTFLDEELPRADGFSPGDPRALYSALGPTFGAGKRPAPLDIDAATTFAPQPYERARKHLKDLFYSKGYLNAVVGPVSLMRARCDPKRSGGGCVPEALPPIKPRCDTDELGLPLPEPPLPASHRCEHDATGGVECAPEVTVVLPIHLGPRSILYDIAFEGNRQVPEQRLAAVADLRLGRPVSSLELEAARLRLLDFYQSRGYAYADVRASIEPSPDRTRARAKFTVSEHEVVFVRGVVVKGAKRTDEALIRSRVALTVGLPYRQDIARLSEERIAALGTFTSVSVGLEDPDVPQRDKRVVVSVVEQLTQYLDPRVGFSTGEGFRLAFEYGNRNLAGGAQALTLRVQLSYLPDIFVPESVKQAYRAANFDNIGARLERRNAASLLLPDIGLGPLVGLNVDLLDINDIQRDFALTKEALVPTVTFRPSRQLTFQGSLTAEYNKVQVFLSCVPGQDPGDTTDDCFRAETLNILRVPEGQSVAFSQRVGGTYDGRNNPFAATSGILLAGGVEHVNAFAIATDSAEAQPDQPDSHFLKLTGKASGYVPLGPQGFSLAMSLSGGWNVQLEDGSATYPDRLFFLGGVDSIRSFLADSVVPQDVADCINRKSDDESCFRGTDDGKVRVRIEDVPIRGGDLSLLSRLELRFPLPVTSFLQGGLVLDMGNLWRNWQKFAVNERLLRYGLGLGIRIVTPIGPIAFDYGFNLLRNRWEDIGAFQFSIGVF
jgi:outer membrane protein insertion porin family